ncbi:MAG: DUF5829 family protein [Crocinitomicaceae bacterium]|nr:DUF5829 family protein [Crocinitomicaceae bacterium]
MRIKLIISWCLFILHSTSSFSQNTSDLICFNHSLLVVDSTTYEAAIHSEFIAKFAYSHEKKLIGYEGFYLIGKTNYIEIFHENSFQGEKLNPGDIWVCTASLQANYIKTLDKLAPPSIQYKENENYNLLSIILEDSIVPLTTWEMTKKQYESWTKKEYHDSVSFLPVDYNSLEESDSASNYLMNDVEGLRLSLQKKDSLVIANYLNQIGFVKRTTHDEYTRFYNGDQFIELHFKEKDIVPTINRFYIKLNQYTDPTTEIIGNSRIECNGLSAIWIFD